MDLISFSVMGIAIALSLLMGARRGYLRLEAVELDRNFYNMVLYPSLEWEQGGPNDRNVSWAVFFHRPYCGACRRIRPVFESLAKTTNSSEHLRFGTLDCMRHRTFCEREGIEREPSIRLYSPLPEGPKGAVKIKLTKGQRPRWIRRGVATWQGMLVAYEVFDWFTALQQQGLLSPAIEWPSEDVLSTAMADFKQSQKHTGTAMTTITQKPENPTGYLKDIEAALYMGLIDDVFGGHKVLSGKRLQIMLNWIEVLTHTYPKKEMRERLYQLSTLLSRKYEWRSKEYQAQIQAWGAKEPTHPESYDWCASSGGHESGTGGYPCALWLLFHTILANSDTSHAHLTLQIIHQWIQNFYGCVECAAHFNEEWEDLRGEDAIGHMSTSLWLWRAHNMVRERLTEEDEDFEPKLQWPSVDQCEQCYTPTGRSSPITDRWDLSQWDEHSVFPFLQETFCQGSDTFVCAGFVDGQ